MENVTPKRTKPKIETPVAIPSRIFSCKLVAANCLDYSRPL
jgi:hypothetical protein